MERPVKAVVIILCGVPGAALTLFGLNFITSGAMHAHESPAWLLYALGAIALCLAAVLFSLLAAAIGALSSRHSRSLGSQATPRRNGGNA